MAELKLRSNQKGFSALEVILIFVVVGLVAGIGLFVWQRQQPDDPAPQTQQSAETINPVARGYEVTDVNIDIVELSDFDKLPPKTPKDFVEALKEKFRKDNSDSSRECSTVFTVEKISQINVKASKGWAEVIGGKIVKDSQICGGGTMSVWAFDGGNWMERVAGNDLPSCERLIEPIIYSEFLNECYGEGSELKILENPNGSIANAPRYE